MDNKTIVTILSKADENNLSNAHYYTINKEIDENRLRKIISELYGETTTVKSALIDPYTNCKQLIRAYYNI